MRNPVLAALVVLLGAPNARAEPAPPSVVRLAVYVPGVPFGSLDERGRFVSGLSAALGTGLGVRVQGRAYANLVDLEKDLGEIAFAIVESPVAATTRSLRPLAVAVVGGDTEVQLALFGLDKARGKLEGRRLAHVRLGRATAGIIDGLLFDGDPSAALIKRVPVPDVASGTSLLKLDKADYLVAYADQLEGLRASVPGVQILLRSVRVPGLTLALGGASGAARLAAKAQSALALLPSPLLGISGFRPASAGEFDALRHGVAARARRSPLLFEPALRWGGGKVSPPAADLPRPTIQSLFAPPAALVSK